MRQCAGRAPRSLSSRKKPVTPRTCLIVDDSRIIRKVARRIVEGLKFDVDEAADGSEALTFCAGVMPDVILLDWSMPVMDGLTFLRRLRALPGGDRPKVLFCTIEADPARISEALAAGADEYVMKPFDGDVLAAKFEEAGVG